jgi:hypothetical protein
MYHDALIALLFLTMLFAPAFVAVLPQARKEVEEYEEQ